MAAKLWIGTESRAERLRRLSVVFANELSLKIAAELYMREMSSKLFYEEFGGGSPARVKRTFDRLDKTGWLRWVRSEGPGGRRRGAREHFYRATEPVFIDPQTWASLPYSIRVAFSWNAFRQIATRLRGAMEAGTFAARPGSSPTFTQLRLDQLGWQRVFEAISEQFVLIFEEQTDARLRMDRSGEQPVRASIVQIAFQSAIPLSTRVGPLLVESEDPLVPFPTRLSKVFADELCLAIIDEANRREISASLTYRDIGGDTVNGIHRRFAMLDTIGWLRWVRSEGPGGRRHGAVEKFYRAAGPAIFEDDGPWANVPDRLRETEHWQAFERLSALAKEAMRKGTFDARDNRCLAWSLLQLDRQGWQKVTGSLDDLRASILDEGQCAEARMRVSGERAAPVVVALGGFESPKKAEREM
jgi:hypothetical protein